MAVKATTLLKMVKSSGVDMKYLLYLVLMFQSNSYWQEHPKIRTVEDDTLGDILTDIEEHLPADHKSKYVDKVTWAHEATHSINNLLRRSHAYHNAFYVLNDQFVLIQEPTGVTIANIRNQIPPLFHDNQYSLYLTGKQVSEWNLSPLYILDEWVAYTNASECVLELLEKDLWRETDKGQGEAMIMTKFNVYALVMLSNTTNPEPKLTQFIEWNLRRSLSIWERSEMEPKARMDETMVFWRNFLTLPQTQTLRNQIKEKNPHIVTGKQIGRAHV